MNEDLYSYRFFETFPHADRRGYLFGLGLSYTSFSITAENCVFCSGCLTAAVSVRNTGIIAGRETAQRYISKTQGCLEQPSKELIASEKRVLYAY